MDVHTRVTQRCLAICWVRSYSNIFFQTHPFSNCYVSLNVVTVKENDVPESIFKFHVTPANSKNANNSPFVASSWAQNVPLAELM